MEANVAEIERERRRLTQELADVTERLTQELADVTELLEEERTERRAVQALLGRCGDSLMWWANQAKEQKRWVAELRNAWREEQEARLEQMQETQKDMCEAIAALKLEVAAVKEQRRITLL